MESKFRKMVEILLLVIFSAILILYASLTPLLGEDEGGYITFAREIQKRGLYPNDLGIIKPRVILPLFSHILSPFSYSLSLCKIIVAIFGVLSIFMTYFFCEKYIKKSSGIIGASLLFSIPFFVHYSMINYVEIPIAFFSITCFYFFLKAEKLKDSIIPGIFIGLSLLTKASGILIPFWLFFYSIYKKKLKIWLFTVLIAVLIISPWIIKNYIVFNYPFYYGFSEVHNILFGDPYISKRVPAELTQAAQPIIPPLNIVNNLGLLTTFLAIVGFLYSYYKKNEIGLLCFFSVLIFLIAWYMGLGGIKDIRHYSIIFPQIAIAGALGFSIFFESYKKYGKFFLGILIILALYFGFNVTLTTSSSVRYSENYVNALEWIKSDGKEGDVLMTTFCGSAEFYSERSCVWPVVDLPELMTTNSDEEILEILNKYNIKYILIQRGLVGESYISPGTNVIGIATTNFVSVIESSEKFERVHNSPNLVIYSPGLVLSEIIVYKVYYNTSF